MSCCNLDRQTMVSASVSLGLRTTLSVCMSPSHLVVRILESLLLQDSLNSRLSQPSQPSQPSLLNPFLQPRLRSNPLNQRSLNSHQLVSRLPQFSLLNPSNHLQASRCQSVHNNLPQVAKLQPSLRSPSLQSSLSSSHPTSPLNLWQLHRAASRKTGYQVHMQAAQQCEVRAGFNLVCSDLQNLGACNKQHICVKTPTERRRVKWTELE
eukprot:gene36465-44975_t